ncbi:MAG TPA: hypothetical protein VKS82_12690 [Streptosporangiaceae bacterium]|nr:hypothetical protein [Streptosporangiaceae bacterium]
MGYPRDQVTAAPGQWRGHRTGAPVREQFDTDPGGFSTEEFDRIYASYVPPVPAARARHAGNGHTGYGNAANGSVQAALTGHAPATNGRAPAASPASPPREQRPGPRHGRHPGNDQDNSQPPVHDHRASPDRRSAQDAVSYQPPRPHTPAAPRDTPASRRDTPASRRDTPAARPQVPAPRAGRAGRGPASGFPPKPGEPNPQYSHPQFAAWNRSSVPASSPADVCAEPADGSGAFSLSAAPTWADTGDEGIAAGPRGGVALAERPDTPAAFTGEDIDAWTDGPDRARTLVPGDRPPAFAADTDEADMARRAGRPRHDSVGRAAGLTRATAAKARKAARQRGRTRRRLMAGVCLPAVAVIAVMAYLQNSGGHKARDTANSSPAATLAGSTPSATLGTWQHIDTRAGDPTPLTLGQLFPAQFTVGGVGYVRTVQAANADCARAVFGGRLQAAVRKYGCTQVMRASYLDSQQKLMGTIGVLNLADSAGSDKVGRVTGSSEFIAQLTAASGPTRSLTKGTGLEEAEIKGHYLILTWVEYTTLKAPTTARQRAQLKDFSANLISQTANVSLTSRMVTGQPQVP